MLFIFTFFFFDAHKSGFMHSLTCSFGSLYLPTLPISHWFVECCQHLIAWRCSDYSYGVCVYFNMTWLMRSVGTSYAFLIGQQSRWQLQRHTLISVWIISKFCILWSSHELTSKIVFNASILHCTYYVPINSSRALPVDLLSSELIHFVIIIFRSFA